MAPYTPFLTEHMYQHLKKFVVDDALGETEKGSVHFLMLPQPRYVRYCLILIHYTYCEENREKFSY